MVRTWQTWHSGADLYKGAVVKKPQTWSLQGKGLRGGKWQGSVCGQAFPDGTESNNVEWMGFFDTLSFQWGLGLYIRVIGVFHSACAP